MSISEVSQHPLPNIRGARASSPRPRIQSPRRRLNQIALQYFGEAEVAEVPQGTGMMGSGMGGGHLPSSAFLPRSPVRARYTGTAMEGAGMRAKGMHDFMPSMHRPVVGDDTARGRCPPLTKPQDQTSTPRARHQGQLPRIASSKIRSNTVPGKMQSHQSSSKQMVWDENFMMDEDGEVLPRLPPQNTSPLQVTTKYLVPRMIAKLPPPGRSKWKSGKMQQMKSMVKMKSVQHKSPLPLLQLKEQYLTASGVQSMKNVHTLPKQAMAVTACAFIPTGQFLVTANADGTIQVWNTHSWDRLQQFHAHGDWVTCLAFNPKGHILVTGSDDSFIKVWNTINFSELCSIQAHSSNIRCCAFSPCGNALVTGSADSTLNLKVWSTLTWKMIHELEGHVDYVRCCAFKPDGTCVVSGSDDCTFKVWHAKLWTVSRELLHGSGSTGCAVMSCAFHPQGTFLAAGTTDGGVLIWEPETWHQLRNIRVHDDSVVYCMFNPLGTLLFTSSTDNNAMIWSQADWGVVRKITEHSEFIMGAAFNPEGNLFVSASCDHTIKLWN